MTDRQATHSLWICIPPRTTCHNIRSLRGGMQIHKLCVACRSMAAFLWERNYFVEIMGDIGVYTAARTLRRPWEVDTVAAAIWCCEMLCVGVCRFINCAWLGDRSLRLRRRKIISKKIIFILFLFKLDRRELTAECRNVYVTSALVLLFSPFSQNIPFLRVLVYPAH